MPKYVYEEYETGWWRRFTQEELKAERKIREDKGCGFFQTFETEEDLGETVHLSLQGLKEVARVKAERRKL